MRHKACTIHIKNKRKASNDSSVHDDLLKVVSFNKNSLYEFYESSIETAIPEEWTIIAFVLNDNQLYLVRLERNAEPFLLKLVGFNQQYLEKFKLIIREYYASVNEDKFWNFGKFTKRWKTRGDLNHHLIAYLKDLDENLFGFCRYLLLGSYLDKTTIKKCEDEIRKFYDSFSIKMSDLSAEQKQIVGCIFNFLLDEEIMEQEVTQENIIKHLKSAFEFIGFTDNKRFVDYIIQNFIDKKTLRTRDIKRKHVCLLIDNYLHQISWESLPITQNQAISRMPSMHFLVALLKNQKTMTITKNKSYYIVDPGDDLKYTKEKFEPFFEKQNGWEGIIGRSPTEDKFKKALLEFALFM